MRAELRSLGKPAADTVARRLVAAGELLDVDPESSLGHALAARRTASRVAAVREAVGLAAYRCGRWQLAISELRAYHRMAGRQTHLAVLADCERALGRPERAVDMLRRTQQRTVGMGEWVELLIVAAGARRDLGQLAAAVTMLQIPALRISGSEPWRARLRYAYADSLAAAGRTEEAYRGFANAVELDPQGETDAVDRLLELEGVVIEGDELEEEPDDDSTVPGRHEEVAGTLPDSSNAPDGSGTDEVLSEDHPTAGPTAGVGPAEEPGESSQPGTTERVSRPERYRQ